MAAAPAIAVLGFRPHTYWTPAVAVAGTARAPDILERRRIVFAAGHERHVFHQAAEGDPAKAAALIAKVQAQVEANAVREIAAILADLQGVGLAVRTAVIPAAKSAMSDDLALVLASHSRIHAAEGIFYADIVASACEAVGLTVHRVRERELPDLVCARLKTDRASLDERVKAMGAALGAPWNEDFRVGALAAWAWLDAATQRPTAEAAS